MADRLEIATRIMAGLVSNPAIIASNEQCGWTLVNCTNAQLANFAFDLADALRHRDVCVPKQVPQQEPQA